MPVIKAEEDRWSCLPGMNIICMTICSLLGFHSDLLESGRRSAQSCQSFDERSDLLMSHHTVPDRVRRPDVRSRNEINRA